MGLDARTLLVLTLTLALSDCHVTVTFPKARDYPLDFLDVIRTPPPCGIPKGSGNGGPLTDLTAGSKINVTWHNAYPHRGGFQINLLNEREQFLTPLTTGWRGFTNPTRNVQEVTLPNNTCMNCSIQLLREAGEWSAGSCNNGVYVFHSCADVNIIQSASSGVQDCSQHGQLNGGACQCERLYSGSQCQYKDDCWVNPDCNNGGRCYDISTYYPRRQCFCAPGFFGKSCDKTSTLSRLDNIDMSKYIETLVPGTDEFKIYHYVDKVADEIEVMMKVNTTTWTALGWRPIDYRSGCQAFPPLNRPPPVEPTGASDFWCPQAGCDLKVSWDSNTDNITFVVEGTTGEGNFVGVGISDNGLMANTDVYAAYQSQDGTVQFTDRYAAIRGVEPPVDSSQDAVNVTYSRQNGKTTFAFTRPLVTGDNNDVPITRSHHLIIATGAVSNGVLQNHGAKRWPSASKLCLVNCGSNPEPETTGEPEPQPETTGEPETQPETTGEPETQPETTGEPETQPETNGEPETQPETTGEPETQPETNGEPETQPETNGEPETQPETTVEPETQPEPVATYYCNNAACDIKATWTANADNITFEVVGTAPQDTDYIAFGFSKNPSMANTDVYAAYWLNSETAPTLSDRFAAARGVEPPVDSSQDAVGFTYSRENSKTTFAFTRPLVTGDINDVPMTDRLYLIFATGKVMNGILQYHGTSKWSSASPMCLVNSCAETVTERVNIADEGDPECFGTDNGNTNPDPEGESNPDPEGESNPEPEGEHTPYPEGDSTPEPEGDSTPEPEGESTSEPEGESTSEPEGESTSEPEGESTSEPEGQTTPDPEGETTPEGTGGACGALSAETNPTAGNTLHPMDCVDVVVGAARGIYSRIGDHYTRDRSTPLHDEVYGGQESLVGAIGQETDGQTVIVFRRKLGAQDGADHPFIDALTHVIWARGQKSGEYHHSPAAGIDSDDLCPSDPNYYKEDELKYHGRDGSYRHRGFFTMNFLDEPVIEPVTCDGQWSSCTGTDCSYTASWSVNLVAETVTFTLKGRLSSTVQQWMAIGISKNRFMTTTDAYVGWVDASGTATVWDSWIADARVQPVRDVQPDVTGVTGSVLDGVTTVEFTRPFSTGDETQDYNFDGTCYYFLYSWGGAFNGNNLLKHNNERTISRGQFCFPTCGAVTTPVPPTYTIVRAVPVSINFPKANFDDELLFRSTKKFKDLEEMVISDLKPAYQELLGFLRATVSSFRRGSIMVDFMVELRRAGDNITGIEEMMKSDVDAATRASVLGKIVATYSVDGAYLKVGDPQTDEPVIEPVTCDGQWSSCTGTDCSYTASWSVNQVAETVTFTLQGRLSSTVQQWMAIGISKNRLMTTTDAYVGWVDASGTATVWDSWIADARVQPVRDVQPDVTGVTGSVLDGVTTVEFTRPFSTGDETQDYNFDGTCYYFLYSWGGAFNGNNLLKHNNERTISRGQFCFPTCGAVTTPVPPTYTIVRAVPVSINFPKANFDDELLFRSTKKFKDLEEMVISDLKPAYQELLGFLRATVSSFRRGSIMVDFMVELRRAGDNITGIEEMMKSDVDAATRASVLGKIVATYSVDGAYLKVGDPQTVSTTPPDVGMGVSEGLSILAKVVIAVSVVLVVFIVILGVTKWCYNNHKESKEDRYMMHNNGPGQSGTNGHGSGTGSSDSMGKMSYQSWQDQALSQKQPPGPTYAANQYYKNQTYHQTQPTYVYQQEKPQTGQFYVQDGGKVKYVFRN